MDIPPDVQRDVDRMMDRVEWHDTTPPVGEYAVIDGTHRIKKALGLGVEFTVLCLTAEESYHNLVWAPDAVWAGRDILVGWEKEGPIGIEGVTT